MSSIYGLTHEGEKNPPDAAFGFHAQTIASPREFLEEKIRVIQFMGILPFRPREIIGLPEDYTTHTAPMLWGPYHQQSKNHRAKECFTCLRHFATYPDEDEFFEKMGHEHYRHHNYRKYTFHRLTYIYVLYTLAGYNMKNKFLRWEIIDFVYRNSTSDRKVGFKALERNPYFGGLRKMYYDEILRRMGINPEEVEEAIVNRVLDMAIPAFRKKEEVMKTDTGKREALATLSYMALPEVHTAIQEGSLSQQRIRLEEGDKAVEIPVGYARPGLPSDSEAHSDEFSNIDS